MESNDEMHQFVTWLKHCHPDRATQIIDDLASKAPSPDGAADPQNPLEPPALAVPPE
jgi:hypothetical protein